MPITVELYIYKDDCTEKEIIYQLQRGCNCYKDVSDFDKPESFKKFKLTVEILEGQ